MEEGNVREIINLQVGHYSNYIGAHWLNLQEASFVYDKSKVTDLNHDILFREAKLPNNQEIYVPRLLIIDAKGSLGSTSTYGSLYDQEIEVSTNHADWGGKVDLVEQAKVEKNDFIKGLDEDDARYSEFMERCEGESHGSFSSRISELVKKSKNLRTSRLKNVRTWTDFLRPHLHPKTIFLLDEISHSAINKHSFDLQKTGIVPHCSQNGTENVPQSSKHGRKSMQLNNRCFSSETNHSSQLSQAGYSETNLEKTRTNWSFTDGTTVVNRNIEEIIDRVRLLAEPCDYLQGFHLLTDCHDGMGGVSSVIAEHLGDDYRTKNVFSFCSIPPHFEMSLAVEKQLFLTNIVQFYSEFFKYSSICVPLNLKKDLFSRKLVRFPYFNNSISPYENSSVIASYLETMSTPWRTKNIPESMSNISSNLVLMNRKILEAKFSFPIGLPQDSYFRDWLQNNEIFLNSISGMNDSRLNIPNIAELSSIRGIPNHRVEKSMQYSSYSDCYTRHCWQKYQNKKDTEILQFMSTSGATDPLFTKFPFPQNFAENVDANGLLASKKSDYKGAVESVPAIASLCQNKNTGIYLDSIFQAASKINTRKIPPQVIGGLEQENWENVLEDFYSIVNCYDHKINSAYDSDSD